MHVDCLELLEPLGNVVVHRNVRVLEVVLLEECLRLMIDQHDFFSLPFVTRLEELTLRIVRVLHWFLYAEAMHSLGRAVAA